MLTYDLPFPLNSGGKIRDYHFLKNLSKKHEVTLFSFYREEEQRKYLSDLGFYCKEIWLFKRPKVWSLRNILLSGSTRLPFSAASYYFKGFKARLLDEIQRNKYDLLYFDSFYPAVYLPDVLTTKIKTYLGNVNVEWRIYERFTKEIKLLPLGWLLMIDVLKMRHFEERLWQLADFNTAVSEADASEIKRATGKACPVVFNGVDVSSFGKAVFKDKKEKKVIFVGNLKYAANHEAMKFFLGEVFPEIKKRLSSVNFELVSMYEPPWLKKYLVDTVVHYIKDSRTPSVHFFKNASVSVCPMRVASGTNIKILESMAACVPVVATTIGGEGLEVKDDTSIVIRDDPEEFAESVVRLLTDKDYAKRIAMNGRRLVEEKYDWKQSFAVFEREVLYRLELLK